MNRRKCLLGSAALFTLAGCLATDEEDDTDPEDDGDDTSPPSDGDDDNGTTPNGEDDAGDDPEHTGDPVGYVPDAAIHQWVFQERHDDVIVDNIGDLNGVAIGPLDNVEGDWRDGFAEYAPTGSDAHIDLGHLDSIGETVIDGGFTLFATIEPETFPAEHSMTIFGAGGGESDWFECRLGHSDGSHPGHPVLFLRDNLGHTIRVIGIEAVETDTVTRLAVRMDGNSAEDVEIFLNGEPMDIDILENEPISGYLHPDQSYGIFASNPTDPGAIGTRRHFHGTIDNVVFCDAPVSEESITEDAEAN